MAQQIAPAERFPQMQDAAPAWQAQDVREEAPDAARAAKQPSQVQRIVASIEESDSPRDTDQPARAAGADAADKPNVVSHPITPATKRSASRKGTAPVTPSSWGKGPVTPASTGRIAEGALSAGSK